VPFSSNSGATAKQLRRDMQISARAALLITEWFEGHAGQFSVLEEEVANLKKKMQNLKKIMQEKKDEIIAV
jgi:ribosomal protein S15P/S13E